MKKILLLEDEKTIGSIYERYLKKAGYTVLWIQTAEKALKEVKNFKADIAIIDHSIEGHEVSGMDVLPSIRRILPDAQIIMLSNYSASQLAGHSFTAGADHYLLKIETPPKLLVQYVDRICNTK